MINNVILLVIYVNIRTWQISDKRISQVAYDKKHILSTNNSKNV